VAGQQRPCVFQNDFGLVRARWISVRCGEIKRKRVGVSGDDTLFYDDFGFSGVDD
jgi:hypothetical protein